MFVTSLRFLILSIYIYTRLYTYIRYTYTVLHIPNTANHAQTRKTHCGLNGGSLDRRKGERRLEILGKAQESNGRRRMAITRERKSTIGRHNANSNETNLTMHPRAEGATLFCHLSPCPANWHYRFISIPSLRDPYANDQVLYVLRVFR